MDRVAGGERVLEPSGVEEPVDPKVRRAFGLLERFAPWIGSRWAVELWCTPPTVDSALKMPPGVARGERVEAAWDGHRVVGEAWGEGPPVYLVHGWGGFREHMGVFVKPLVASGHRVIAFDLPAHNESDSGALAPGRTTLIECTRAVHAMVAEHGPARAIVAHSLGAKAAALGVAQGLPAERLVFLAPMGNFPMYLDLFAQRHGFGPRIRAGLERGLARRIGMPLVETDIPVLAQKTGHVPLLLVHDPDDPDAPYEASQQIVETWPASSLFTTRGLGRLAHYRVLRHRPGINAAVEFIGSASETR
jgi:pimeloyl-ACP methyl ester carboxylesterase